MSLTVKWVDHWREPKCAPNPAYPRGIDVDASDGASTTCATTLPHPAKRCGVYVVTCDTCGLRVALTTAGRSDDPRSLKVACISSQGENIQ